MKVLFLGSSSFSKIVLEKLLQSKHKVVAVVCQPDRPSGRGHKLVSPEIKAYAEENGIKVFQFEKVSQHIDEVFEGVDIAVTASFGQILSRDFIGAKLCLNVHPSLLPKYRGATPLQTALLNGDGKTAVTIQKMVYEVDQGDIILQEGLEIEEDDNFSSLTFKTATLGGKLLVKALDQIENNDVVYTKQDNEQATYTKMIKKEDGLLDFEKSAKENVNKVRALGENPGCFFFVGDDRIKVAKASICFDFEAKPGEILLQNKRFLIGTSNGCFEAKKCQAPNGKMLDAKDFLNGFKFKTLRVNDAAGLQ